jgi:hypothetical protein
MLSQLVYISVRNAECTDQEIEKILESSIRNNGKIDISGVLLYSDQKFLQVLEGEYKQIIELYDTIKEDKRHKNLVMLSLGSIKERNFPSWQMGSKKISLDDVDFNTRMTDEDKQEFKSILSGKKEQSQKVIDVIKKFF